MGDCRKRNGIIICEINLLEKHSTSVDKFVYQTMKALIMSPRRRSWGHASSSWTWLLFSFLSRRSLYFFTLSPLIPGAKSFNMFVRKLPAEQTAINTGPVTNLFPQSVAEAQFSGLINSFVGWTKESRFEFLIVLMFVWRKMFILLELCMKFSETLLC